MKRYAFYDGTEGKLFDWMLVCRSGRRLVFPLNMESSEASEMNLQEHWNQVYETKGPLEVSWFQDNPTVSLRIIQKASIGKEDGILDVDGGASRLAECLLLEGYRNPSVLDLSSAAIAHAKNRLGGRASEIEWIEDD